MSEETFMGGPIVKNYGAYILRDDTEIRRSAGCFEDQIEAYSLFLIKPCRRLKIFGGSKEWAIQEADKEIEYIAQRQSGDL
jgi:hypothetical protein